MEAMLLPPRQACLHKEWWPKNGIIRSREVTVVNFLKWANHKQSRDSSCLATLSLVGGLKCTGRQRGGWKLPSKILPFLPSTFAALSLPRFFKPRNPLCPPVTTALPSSKKCESWLHNCL